MEFDFTCLPTFHPNIIAALHLESEDDEENFFPLYVEYFCEDIDKAEKDLVLAVSKGNAHALAGVAANLRANEVWRLARAVEAAARAGQAPEAALVSALVDEARAVFAAIDAAMT